MWSQLMWAHKCCICNNNKNIYQNPFWPSRQLLLFNGMLQYYKYPLLLFKVYIIIINKTFPSHNDLYAVRWSNRWVSIPRLQQTVISEVEKAAISISCWLQLPVLFLWPSTCDWLSAGTVSWEVHRHWLHSTLLQAHA